MEVQIEYVNAHATSTRNGDEAEAAAIENLLGERVKVSSNKVRDKHLESAILAEE